MIRRPKWTFIVAVKTANRCGSAMATTGLWPMTGTMGDGSTLLETNILRRIDDSTFTWQSIGRDLDNVSLPDLAPVRVERVTPKR